MALIIGSNPQAVVLRRIQIGAFADAGFSSILCQGGTSAQRLGELLLQRVP